jgi:hypothetical protein
MQGERRRGCDHTSERKSGLLLLNCASGLVLVDAPPLAYPQPQPPPSRFGVPGALRRCTGGVPPGELYGDSCRPRLAAIEPLDG